MTPCLPVAPFPPLLCSSYRVSVLNIIIRGGVSVTDPA